MAQGHWPDRRRLLMSYAYLSSKPLPGGYDYLIDSGAFTAATMGKTIDRDAYSAYLRANSSRITAAIALDVIGDHKQSWLNYTAQREQLRGSGVTLVPTWHIRSPLSALEQMCEATDYVSIGGAVGTHAGRLTRLCLQAHKVAAKHGTRLHGLGITSSQVMRLPWYSVDSSSWTYANRYPMIILTAKGGRTVSLTRGKPMTPVQKKLVQDYGLNPALVLDAGATKVGNPRGGRPLVQEYATAMMRAYMETERWGHCSKVYLAGVGGAADYALVDKAHSMGSPFERKKVKA